MNFRRIVAHLAYSPTVIWQLATYDNKIKQDKSRNLKIILFAIMNLVIIAIAVSVNSNHQLSLVTPGLNTKPTSASLASRPIIDKESQIKDFTQNSFFNNINDNPELVQIYKYFGIDSLSTTNMSLVQSPSALSTCVEINRSPVNNLGKIDINSKLSVYAHNCQKQYYGLAIAGKTSDDFIILNNGNLLLKNVDKKTTSALTFSIDVVNTTTNTNSPLVVNPGQSLKYTVRATNTSAKPFNDVVKITLNDISEYAQVLNNSLNSDQSIYWRITNLQSGQSANYDIYVKTHHQFSNQPLNANISTGHDCQLSLGLDNATVSTKANCSLIKQTELFAHKHLTPSRYDHKIFISLLLFFLLVIMFKILHIARINFVSKEIRIIRHKINQGII